MTEEIVALYDEQGRECGSASRLRMRAENLRHAATCIVLRDGAGRIFLHRRTMTKDVFPGLCDFAAGGVLGAGEDPYAGAIRELAEELGITGVDLEVVGEADTPMSILATMPSATRPSRTARSGCSPRRSPGANG